MTDSTDLNDGQAPRSPLLMNFDDSALIVIDAQEKLLPVIKDQANVVWNINRLVQASQLLRVPIFVTEQYPKGLGKTVAPIESLLPKNESFEKLTFSCRECVSLHQQLAESHIQNVVVTGIESHVCIMQSVLDFLSQGFNVFVAVDAIGARFEIDHTTALRRMELSGATLVSTEMAMFEWCETARKPEFKAISKLVQTPFE